MDKPIPVQIALHEYFSLSSRIVTCGKKAASRDQLHAIDSKWLNLLHTLYPSWALGCPFRSRSRGPSRLSSIFLSATTRLKSSSLSPLSTFFTFLSPLSVPTFCPHFVPLSKSSSLSPLSLLSSTSCLKSRSLPLDFLATEDLPSPSHLAETWPVRPGSCRRSGPRNQLHTSRRWRTSNDRFLWGTENRRSEGMR